MGYVDLNRLNCLCFKDEPKENSTNKIIIIIFTIFKTGFFFFFLILGDCMTMWNLAKFIDLYTWSVSLFNWLLFPKIFRNQKRSWLLKT